MAGRRTAVIVVASVFSALAVMGIAFIWTRMRSRSRNDLLHDGMQ
jgi:hypothetical protein